MPAKAGVRCVCNTAASPWQVLSAGTSRCAMGCASGQLPGCTQQLPRAGSGIAHTAYTSLGWRCSSVAQALKASCTTDTAVCFTCTLYASTIAVSLDCASHQAAAWHMLERQTALLRKPLLHVYIACKYDSCDWTAGRTPRCDHCCCCCCRRDATQPSSCCASAAEGIKATCTLHASTIPVWLDCFASLLQQPGHHGCCCCRRDAKQPSSCCASAVERYRGAPPSDAHQASQEPRGALPEQIAAWQLS
jgi:hypothetical protein